MIIFDPVELVWHVSMSRKIYDKLYRSEIFTVHEEKDIVPALKVCETQLNNREKYEHKINWRRQWLSLIFWLKEK